MKSLCWSKKSNEKHCKNYRTNGKTTCRYHIIENYKQCYLKMLSTSCFMFSLAFIYYQYEMNETDSSINTYIYSTINNFSRNINELSYNVYIYMKSYNIIGIQNYFKLYMINLYKYDNFLFNYTVENIHSFALMRFHVFYNTIFNAIF